MYVVCCSTHIRMSVYTLACGTRSEVYTPRLPA